MIFETIIKRQTYVTRIDALSRSRKRLVLYSHKTNKQTVEKIESILEQLNLI